MFGKGLRISILGLSVCVCSCVCRQPSLTLFICYRALLCSVSHWHCAQSHKLRCEAGGGGLYCHINKHMHNQDPEKVQWESRCHFSHVALMGAWRVNILIIFFFNPPGLVLLGLFTWRRWENSEFGAPTESSQRTKMCTVVMVTASNALVNQLYSGELVTL